METAATANFSHSALIVDFPSRAEKNKRRRKIKSVRFSQTCQGRFISYPSQEERDAISYSSNDYNRFQQTMVRDAMKCSKNLEEVTAHSSKDKKVYEKHIIRCVGLDHLVSRNVEKRYNALKEAKKEHTRIVIEEQEWQRMNNVYSVDLSSVSMASSYSNRLRSHKVAVMSASVSL